jgi:hypothetical protein
VNVPRTLGAVISGRLATQVELDTVLGVEDMYNLLEIQNIDAYNEYLSTKQD